LLWIARPRHHRLRYRMARGGRRHNGNGEEKAASRPHDVFSPILNGATAGAFTR
jgi:hypothetical protein